MTRTFPSATEFEPEFVEGLKTLFEERIVFFGVMIGWFLLSYFRIRSGMSAFSR